MKKEKNVELLSREKFKQKLSEVTGNPKLEVLKEVEMKNKGSIRKTMISTFLMVSE